MWSQVNLSSRDQQNNILETALSKEKFFFTFSKIYTSVVDWGDENQ